MDILFLTHSKYQLDTFCLQENPFGDEYQINLSTIKQ